MSEERSDEFYEEFGRMVLKLFDWQGKSLPVPKAMKNSPYGLQVIGRMSYEKLEKKGNDDFQMMVYQVEQTLESRQADNETP